MGLGTPLRDGCRILNNTAAEGGGIFRAGSNITARDCLIQGNTASAGVGGGVGFTARSGEVILLIVNCDFIENHAVGGTEGGRGVVGA